MRIFLWHTLSTESNRTWSNSASGCGTWNTRLRAFGGPDRECEAYTCLRQGCTPGSVARTESSPQEPGHGFAAPNLSAGVLPCSAKHIWDRGGRTSDTRGRRVRNTTGLKLALLVVAIAGASSGTGGRRKHATAKARHKEFSVYDFGAGLAEQPIPPDLIRLEANWKDTFSGTARAERQLRTPRSFSLNPQPDNAQKSLAENAFVVTMRRQFHETWLGFFAV